MKALSIRQPWAWLIVHGYKDVENRTWATNYRGELYIHAGKTFDTDAIKWVLSHFPELIGVLPEDKHAYDLGGIVGKVNLIDCVDSYPSPWFFGPIGWVFGQAAALEFIPLKGSLGLFKIDINPGKELETYVSGGKKQTYSSWLDKVSKYDPEKEAWYDVEPGLSTDTIEEEAPSKVDESVEEEEDEEEEEEGKKPPPKPGPLPKPDPLYDRCPYPDPPLSGMPG